MGIGGLWESFTHSFFTISLPRDVVISNRRLGVLRRLLEFAMICWIAVSVILDRAWMKRLEPTSHGDSLWVGESDPELLQNSSVLHCQEPEQYDYVWDEDFTYQPRRCKSLSIGEMFHRDVNYVGLPTYIQDTFTWASSGSDCSAAAKAACESIENAIYKSTADQCECHVLEEYLVKNVDTQRLTLTHGYKVRSTSGEELRTGSSKTDVLTIILDQAGNPCPVGAPDGGGAGKSHWLPAESFTGISGSAREWLACAGSSLDMRSPENARKLDDDQLAPYLRITGVLLDFDIDFQDENGHSEDYDGVVCYIRLSAVPAWVAKNDVIPIPPERIMKLEESDPARSGPGTSAMATRLRYGYYLSASLRTRGTFQYFDHTGLLYAITSSTVLMTLPGIFVYWFALYGVGMLSRIYYKATVELFNVRKLMPDVGAQLVSACSSFSAIAGTERGSVLRHQDIKTCVSAVFNGTLNYSSEDSNMVDKKTFSDEVAIVSQVFLESMDTTESGNVDLEEFVRAYMESGRMGVMDLVEFFDTKRKAGFLERLFSSESTRSLRKTALRSAYAETGRETATPWPSARNARQTVPAP